MAPNWVGVMIDVRRAFEEYAKTAMPPAEWDGLLAAHRWFRCGSCLRQFWRHSIYRRLWPCRYDERRLQAEDAERHMKRVVIAAVMGNVSKAMPRRQNWREN